MMVNKIHRKNSAKLLLVGLLLSSSCVRADIVADTRPPTHFAGCQKNNTLFFAYTKDKQQAVELCQIKGRYRYTFGHFTVSGTELKEVKGKSVQKTFMPGNAGSIHRDDTGGFAIKDGDTFIWLEAEISGALNLVTATSGWNGWEMAVNRHAVALEMMGLGFINQIDALDMVPFCYDYTKFKAVP